MRLHELLTVFKAARNGSGHIRAEIRCSRLTAIQYILVASELGLIDLDTHERGILERLKMESNPRGTQPFIMRLTENFGDTHALTLSRQLEDSMVSFHAVH